ncbi:hypothetical protein BGZ70_000852 [Mortierella alpina]|uniref:MPN domain-containing protein n=1 Tax=Mortierella alpina TaxID=64518 RepID=A0A9P6IXH5_MORAP|nr:hypothetical protein BGZ70_000852 [Mortierella alpina]
MRGSKVEKCFSRKELNNRAKADVVDQTPIRFYIRKIYQEEGDVQTSYILYVRFCKYGSSMDYSITAKNLVVYELKKHPEYSNPDYKVALAALKKRAMNAMDEIGKLNPILDQKYEEYQEYIRQREEMMLSAQAQAQDAQLQHEVQLQHQRHYPQQQQQQQQQDHHALQFTGNPPVQGWSLAKALEGVPGINLLQNGHHPNQHHHAHQQSHEIASQIQYPEHHRLHHHHHQNRTEHPTPSTRPPTVHPTPTGPPPALPRKPISTANGPKLPPKVQMEEDVHEFSQGLRTMIVPVRLLDRFLNIVRPNTIKKLETCGILAGVLSRNKLTVTTLIIPKQTATSDTCSTTNEDELFEFQSERDLMTLGWIHTHPTQTCFMSSVDLHTHCSYQLMLPEAIAIVCAPSHDKDYGVFRLTDPPGLQVITNCRQKPLFHQHPGEDDIYTDACDQGHVELKDLELEIVDLRKK